MVCKRAEIKRIAKEFAIKLKERNIDVKFIVLFGSYAWGVPRGTSDIDLAVISPQFKRMSQLKRLELLSDISRKISISLPIDIDVVGFTPDEIDHAGYFDLAAQIREKGDIILKAA